MTCKKSLLGKYTKGLQTTYQGFVQRKSSRLFSAGSLQSITKNYSQIPVTFFRRVAAAKWWVFLSVFVCSLENI